MRGESYRSWGLFPSVNYEVRKLESSRVALPLGSCEKTFLPFGNGRSYGDSCLNDGGVLLDCRGLNKILDFDLDAQTVTVEAGVLISDILKLVVPCGWFLAVTPGTKFVTVGGAIANDVHGKNHHRRGTFGNCVEAFELLRSDGSRLLCSRRQNPDWFAATIGGMGLTGVITWAKLNLMRTVGAAIDQEIVPFASVDEFVALAAAKDPECEYSVAWIDSTATGRALGRGLLICGNHARGTTVDASSIARRPRFGVPFTPPFSLLNKYSIKAFNALYCQRQLAGPPRTTVHFNSFFYPLDGVANWNRLYGPRGLLQHQSALPPATGAEAVKALLECCHIHGIGSFLTVLKAFGPIASPGLLSFPRPGLTLTLDFSNQGRRTFALLDDLDAIVAQVGGATNPYKDARMSRATFRRSFPRWQELCRFIDPRFSSSFWRRVSDGAAYAVHAPDIYQTSMPGEAEARRNAMSKV